MLHRSCNHGIIANNVVYDNGDSGIALFESANTDVYGNTLSNNKCEQQLVLAYLEQNLL